jgi:hypothetical protein
MFASLVKTGRTVDDARTTLMGSGLGAEAIDSAIQRYHALVQRVRVMKEPAGMFTPRKPSDDWYPGPSETDPCWPRLRNYLTADKKWPTDVVNSVDKASTKIVSSLSAPGREAFTTRGLVLGYVQSGKTANFTAVISKAADAGYKVFIVLSGLHNGLRKQTQQRLDVELSDLKPDHWFSLTSDADDFRPPSGGATAFLSDNANQRVICVMKKNGPRLRALLKWLKGCDKLLLDNTPMLMIDDEADQASIDTRNTDNPSAINKLILELLRLFKRGAYVAYTATPFANILSDPQTADLLYPRDFIIDLPRPAAYFGAERIFGLDSPEDIDGTGRSGLDMVREVPEAEVKQVQPPTREARSEFEPSLPPTLVDAFDWFLLGCAVRRVRGQGDQHMSMLVHTTLYTDVHGKFKHIFRGRLAHYRGLWARGEIALQERLAALFVSETAAVVPESLGEQPVSFDEAWLKLDEVLSNAQIFIDNAKSESRLVYPKEGGSTTIVVGGNTLSRGLTIEGLMVSYFVRTSTMYDALLQMGRWFGYRGGYSDLPRIWMTEDLEEAFVHLALVEGELRSDIGRYEREGLTPLDFAPRIRAHSSLAVTCPLKMRYAVDAEVSYGGAVKQTTYFEHLDSAWLHRNTKAARALLKRADARHASEIVWKRHVLWRDVDVASVLDFLAEYQIHQRHSDMKSDLLSAYIRAQNDERQLLRWNVAVVGQSRGSGSNGLGLLPNGEDVPLLVRARMKGSGAANLKQIMSQPDRGIDLPLPPPTDARSLVERMEHARAGVGVPCNPATGANTPLLLLYPISKDSKPGGGAVSSPEGESGNRTALDAVEHLVGMALVFPEPRRLTPQRYITADLSRVAEPIEMLEYTPEDEIA